MSEASDDEMDSELEVLDYVALLHINEEQRNKIASLESANTELRAGNIRLAVELKDWRDRAYERLSEVAELDRENKSLSAALSQCRNALEPITNTDDGCPECGQVGSEETKWVPKHLKPCRVGKALAIPPPPASAEKQKEKRADYADPNTCGVEFFRKDLNMDSVCGRKPGHAGEHSWYHDCGLCGGNAGEHKKNCATLPEPKKEDRP